jgi:hypothetical protein
MRIDPVTLRVPLVVEKDVHHWFVFSVVLA